MSEPGEQDQVNEEVVSKPEVFWRENKSGEQKPASTSLNPEFITLLEQSPPGTFLDIGTGTGRIIPEIPSQHHIVGLDINQDELVQAQEKDIEGASFVRARGEALPIADQSVDGAFLLGVLSTVDKGKRDKMLKEVDRVVKEGGLVYVAEFTRIEDPEARTVRDNKLWSDVYRDDESETDEYGTIVARNPDGSPKFHAHHFTKEELVESFEQNNLEVLGVQKVKVKSTVSGADRDNWNVWGTKKPVPS